MNMRLVDDRGSYTDLAKFQNFLHEEVARHIGSKFAEGRMACDAVFRGVAVCAVVSFADGEVVVSINERAGAAKTRGAAKRGDAADAARVGDGGLKTGGLRSESDKELASADEAIEDACRQLAVRLSHRD